MINISRPFLEQFYIIAEYLLWYPLKYLTDFKRHSVLSAKVVNGYCYEDFYIFEDSPGRQNVLGLDWFVLFVGTSESSVFEKSWYCFSFSVIPYLLKLRYVVIHTSVLRGPVAWNFRKIMQYCCTVLGSLTVFRWCLWE